jgi:hypothetical protein
VAYQNPRFQPLSPTLKTHRFTPRKLRFDAVPESIGFSTATVRLAESERMRICEREPRDKKPGILLSTAPARILPWKGGWNYYGYGEDGPVGPTSPRNFHANILTLALHYEF